MAEGETGRCLNKYHVTKISLNKITCQEKGMSMPDPPKFWILKSSDAIVLVVCFKKEKKIHEEQH